MRPSLVAPLSISFGMMLFAINDNFVATVSESMSVWQYHTMRSGLILPVMVLALILLGQGRSIWPVRPSAVFTRAVFTVSSLMLYFAAIPAIGVSLAAAGLFTSPIFVVLVSVFVFREGISALRLAGIALGFVGVCLVLEIGAAPLQPMALAPMLGGCLYALNVIWTRRYCQAESAGCLSFWNMSMFLLAGALGMALTPGISGLIGGIEGTEFATMDPNWPDRTATLILLAMGAGGAIGMACMAIGYRSAPSSYAALFDYSFLIWIPFFAWIFHGDILSLNMTAGIVLIILAGILALVSAPKEVEPATRP